MNDHTAVPDWIEIVAGPLDDDPELGLAARRELLELGAEADPAQCEAIGKRLRKRARGGWRRGWPVLSWVPLALALALLAMQIPRFFRIRMLQTIIVSMALGPGDPPMESRLGKAMDAEARLLVFGDASQPTEELARKARWDRAPADPAFFAHYLAATDPLPEDFLETARRLDPGNGWFHLLAAGEIAKDAVEKERAPYRSQEERDDPDRKRTSTYQIHDAAKFASAVALLHEAAAQERLVSHEPGLLKRQLAALPPETDFESRVFRMVLAASSDTSNVFRVMRILDLVAAEANRLAAAGARDDLRRLVHTVEVLTSRLAAQDGTFIDGLVAQAIALSTHEHLMEACESLELTEESNRLRPVVMALRRMAELRRESDDPEAELVKMHGEVLTALSSARILTGFGVRSPAIAEMTPGRLMDYALLERLCLSALALLLLLATIPLALAPLLRGRLARRLGGRFRELIGGRDWLWIALLGVVAPFLWYFGITWLTPLGCRDLSLVFMGFPPPASIQAGLLLPLIVTAALGATKWRLGRQGGSLQVGSRRPLVGAFPALVTALALPVAGLVRFTNGNGPLLVAGGMGGLVVLWLFFRLARLVLGPRRLAPGRVAVARVLIPALGSAAVLGLALIPITIRAERHFLARDSLGRTSPEHWGVSRIEADNAAAVYRVLREALEAE